MGPLLPPPPIRRSFVLRVSVVWAFARIITLVGASLESGAGQDSSLGVLPLALLVDPVVVLVVMLDMRRRAELMFLANLGWSLRQIASSAVGACLLMEALLRVVVG
ncbi:MAG: hypothetical protein R3E10_03850 [Gemmatimonadota bacterium]